MKFIVSQINTIQELKSIPQEFGIEVSLRDYNKNIILQQNPFEAGELFEDYLKVYNHDRLVLNIKNEGIETRVQELLHQHQIKNYFFVNSAFPIIYSLTQTDESNLAVRFSEFECLESVLMMTGLVQWVWVDCFTQLPLETRNAKDLKDAGFKICVVSPDLNGRAEDIKNYREYLETNKIYIDAVCTNLTNIPLWT